MTKLFLKIEEAEHVRENAIDVSDAICDLSRHDLATSALIHEYTRLILDAERQWWIIEETPEFKEKYSNREQAQDDFLKAYFAKRSDCL